jgi:release factor glutamine methyltransferase
MTGHYLDLVLETTNDVYMPAEDSFLLADNLDVRDGRVLDVGTGCGIQALAAAGCAEYVLGVDVNPQAVALARRNASRNNIRNVEFRVSDLFENVDGFFDQVIFNPPYLPVDDEGGLTKSWAGGDKGLEVTSRFIEGAPRHLKPSGGITLLISGVNGVDDVMGNLRGDGFTPEIKAKKKLFFEELYIVWAAYKS